MSFEIKYLKYKKKYFNLKKLIGGAAYLALASGGDTPSDNAALQNACIDRLFRIIQAMNIEELHTKRKELCNEFNSNIILAEKYEFTNNIRSNIVINMLVPFFLQEEIYTLQNVPYTKIDELNRLTYEHVYLGRIIKEHHLINLNPYPEKSLELLNSCKDEEKYCMMAPKYLSIDYKQIEYYCNSNDLNKIQRINNNEDLLNIKDGHYLYCILPTEILCLFQGHHSAGACGQPVICAGYITIVNKKIIKIDNSSGHYAPPFDMLIKAIEILKIKEIIIGEGREDESKGGGQIKEFIF